MRNKTSISIFLGVIFIFLLSFSSSKDYRNELQSDFNLSIKASKKSAIELENTLQLGSENQLLNKYNQLRSAYKECEPWLLYLDPELVKLELNGAPLPHLEKNSPNPSVIQPKGLQCLDEVIAELLIEGDDSISIKQEYIDKAILYLQNFKTSLNIAAQEINLTAISQRMVFEMYRTNMVKLMTLEQTGFDTPGTKLGIKDSKTTFQTISKHMKLCIESLVFKNNFQKKDIDTFVNLTAKALKFLNENTGDFNSFDRFNFTKNYIEPLFQQSVLIQKNSGIEFYEEISNRELAINTQSEHIFIDAFLNKSFFSGVSSNNMELIALGRKIFNEPLLSKEGKMSCASCHQSNKAFTDQLPKSASIIEGKLLNRNAPTLLNSVYASDYFSDLRANQMRDQIEHVVFSPDEFNSNFHIIEQQLSENNYQTDFNTAFGENSAINKNNIEESLVAYVQSLSSWNSPVDQYLRGEIDTISETITLGYNLFMGKAQCGTCHFPPTFAGLAPPFFEESESEVLGVTEKFDSITPVLDSDLGRALSTKIKDRNIIFDRSFKTPTVRNATNTFPYMHNGGFSTLKEVMSFYNKGGGSGLGLEVQNQTLSDMPLNLSQDEINHIIDFLNALTDNPFSDY